MPKSQLLEKMRMEIRLRHYSLRTEQSYIHWVRRFILFHNKRHPAEMGESEITAYLTHLAVDRKVSASTQNQSLSAILFLYKQVLDIRLEWLDEVVRAKRPQHLPVILSRKEVGILLDEVRNKRPDRTSACTVPECEKWSACGFAYKDVDFDYRQITVRSGKGDKDRITMLPDSLIDPIGNISKGCAVFTA